MSNTGLPGTITTAEWAHVAWMCLCHQCGDTGTKQIFDKDDPDNPFLGQCDTCNGTGREPIPWSEVFTAGRLWVPDWFGDRDDEDYDDS